MPDLFHITLITPIFISLFFAIILLFYPNKNENAKKRLGVFMLTSALFLFLIFLYQSKQFTLFSKIDPFYMSMLILIHPLFYIYIKTLSNFERKIKIAYFHYIPFIVILCLAYYLYFQLTSEEKLYYLTKTMNGEKALNNNMLALFFIFITSKIIYISQVVVYFVLINNQLNRHHAYIESNYSNEAKYNLRWVKSINIFFLIGAITGVVVNMIPTEILNEHHIYIMTLYVVFSIFYFTIGFLEITRPILIYEEVLSCIEDNIEQVSSDAIAKFNELHQYVTVNKLYLNPDLKISDLCLPLRSNRTYISNLINQHSGLNFCNYINQLRVDYAKGLLSNNVRQDTIETISEACGFNSVITMHRAFKKFEGTSPGGYTTTKP